MDSNHEIEQLRQVITQLGNQLEKLGREKEGIYQEKKSIEVLLSNSIGTAKDLKAQKSIIDDQIREKKVLRTTLNKELKTLHSQLPKQKKPVHRGSGESAEQLKRQIEAMQFSIETEGLSFEREQNYMTRIKQLKVKLVELGVTSNSGKDAQELKVQLSSKKSVADSAHAEIQKLAEKSASLFQDLTKKAQEISVFKGNRQNMQEKLKAVKITIDTANADLAETLNKWLVLTKDLPIEQKPVMTESMANKEEEQSIISKFKNAKRLTKEDILKLQRLAARKR